MVLGLGLVLGFKDMINEYIVVLWESVLLGWLFVFLVFCFLYKCLVMFMGILIILYRDFMYVFLFWIGSFFVMLCKGFWWILEKLDGLLEFFGFFLDGFGFLRI